PGLRHHPGADPRRPEEQRRPAAGRPRPGRHRQRDPARAAVSGVPGPAAQPQPRHPVRAGDRDHRPAPGRADGGDHHRPPLPADPHRSGDRRHDRGAGPGGRVHRPDPQPDRHGQGAGATSGADPQRHPHHSGRWLDRGRSLVGAGPPAVPGLRRRRRSLAALTVVLLAAIFLIGPAAGPAWAQGTEGGDLIEYEVVDRYGISVHDYSIEGRQGGGVDGTFKRLGIWLADVLFSTSRAIVVALIWLLNFALEFGVAELMLTPVEQLIEVYEANFIGNISGGGWGLVPLALMICVFWFGLAALRGQVGKGFGEITDSFVLAVVLGAVLANPGGFLLSDEGLVGRARDIGADVAVTAVRPAGSAGPAPCVQQPPGGGQDLVDGCFQDITGDGTPPTRNDPQYLRWIMQMWLVDMYVRRPHQQMAYGQRLDCPLV